MRWLRQLERRLQPYAIPNLTLVLLLGQLCMLLLSTARPEVYEKAVLQPSLVAAGEWWRLLMFMFLPTFGGLLWVLGALFFYTMGTGLEAAWGTFRYNVFILMGYLFSVAGAALSALLPGGDAPLTNAYIFGSVFLAFAYLYPDYQLFVLLIIPVKIKWLALLTLAGYILMFVAGLGTFRLGGWVVVVMLIAGNMNLVVFLGRDAFDRLRNRSRGVWRRIEHDRGRVTARHTCAVCGATDITNPEREFRYCTQCEGTPAYCNLHLANHEHRVKASSPDVAK